MRVGITGASGLLGHSLCELIGEEDRYHAILIDRSQIEFTSHLKTLAYLKNLSIDSVIHCAANTNVEECEKDQDSCYRDNWLLTECLVEASRGCGAKFVFISSTGLYGNCSNKPYREYDIPQPTTAHHKSKYLAEKAVISRAVDPLVIRTGWLFGGAANNPKNFVANRLKEILYASGSIQSDISQIGNPTFVGDIGKHILKLLDHGATGIFNCVSPNPTTRYDYVSEIVALSGVGLKVKPVDGSHFKRLAKVSPNESAINFRLKQLGLDDMPGWKQRLAEYVPKILESIRREF